MSLFSAEPLRAAWNTLVRLLGAKKPPEADPYAYISAPTKPRPPHRSAAAVADPPE